MLQACIFDMDGVIIDSEPLHYDVDFQIEKKLGYELTHRDLDRYVCMTNPEMWKQIKLMYSLQESIEELIRLQLELKLRLLNEKEEVPIAGIVELLEELQSFGKRIGLASSSPRCFIEAVLEKFGITSYFQVCVSGEEVERGKPAPDVFLATAAELQVDVRRCVVIEDSRNGVAAAKAAGMACVGFVNPNSGQQDLSQADLVTASIASLNVHSLEQLLGK
jgi:HAD superfamily hydrolase (TIGR01509 family)